MLTTPRVLVRKTQARRSWKGAWASRSWASPKVGEERGGKGMQEIGLRDGRFWGGFEEEGEGGGGGGGGGGK